MVVLFAQPHLEAILARLQHRALPIRPLSPPRGLGRHEVLHTVVRELAHARVDVGELPPLGQVLPVGRVRPGASAAAHALLRNRLRPEALLRRHLLRVLPSRAPVPSDARVAARPRVAARANRAAVALGTRLARGPTRPLDACRAVRAHGRDAARPAVALPALLARRPVGAGVPLGPALALRALVAEEAAGADRAARALGAGGTAVADLTLAALLAAHALLAGDAGAALEPRAALRALVALVALGPDKPARAAEAEASWLAREHLNGARHRLAELAHELLLKGGQLRELPLERLNLGHQPAAALRVAVGEQTPVAVDAVGVVLVNDLLVPVQAASVEGVSQLLRGRSRALEDRPRCAGAPRHRNADRHGHDSSHDQAQSACPGSPAPWHELCATPENHFASR
mmetsp:Transcript_20342/g.48239  ORF Transcript_20342/g.48239 Transcript_20342/m.48239 type:complete len:402 (-) Transcript_20342:3-1208(-)